MKIADTMIECVLAGGIPDEVVEQATGGMLNALQRLPASRQCSDPDCAFKVPKYPGAYPKKCPECGAPMMAPGEGGGEGE